MADKEKFLDVPFEVKAEDIQENGTFKGHGSLFNKIPDSYGDIVSRGAFIDTIAHGGRNKSGIAMLWQHRVDQIPGVWDSMVEDKKGLAVSGVLALKTSLGNDVYELMKLASSVGTFKLGLSMGYDALEYDVDEKKKIRELKKVELWEMSIVTFPAKLGAMVSQVKSLESAKTERELEAALRESGLSKNDSQYIVKLCKPSLRESGDGGDDGDDGLSMLLNGLKSVNEDLEVFRQTKGMANILDALKQINV